MRLPTACCVQPWLSVSVMQSLHTVSPIKRTLPGSVCGSAAMFPYSAAFTQTSECLRGSVPTSPPFTLLKINSRCVTRDHHGEASEGGSEHEKKNLINEADFPLSDGWLMVRSLPPPAARLFPWRSQPESLLLALCKYVQINEHTCADMPTHITHRSHYLPPVWKSTLLTSLTMCSFPNLYSLFHTFWLKYNKVEEIRCRKSSCTKRKPNIYIYINGLNNSN